MHHIHVYNALKFTLINNITRLMIYRNMYIKRHLCNVLGEKNEILSRFGVFQMGDRYVYRSRFLSTNDRQV